MINLDQISKNILQELGRDGRITNLDLAEKVGLSPSACLRRVQDLERRNIITGYKAVVNRAAMGIGITAFITVGLSRHQKQDQDAFERAMEHAPEVRECHNVTGSFEYILRVEVTDLEAYKEFHTNILGTVPQVNSISSHICMGSPKDKRG
jgi:DNA-binding Lrp family transcriptional regulator